MLPKAKNNWLKFHHCLFAGLIWTVIFVTIECYQCSIVASVQKAYLNSGCYPIFTLETCDYNIPLIPWFNIFYLTAVPTWTVLPIFIYLIYGPRRYAKLLSREIFVFIICSIVALLFPVSCQPILDYADQVMIDKFGFWNDIQKWMLSTNHSPFLSFPSNHCVCQILLLYAVIDFNFIDKTNKNDSTKTKIIKWTLTTILCFFTVMVCTSTYVLKVHFFVDWIPSFIICTFVWVAMHFIKHDRITVFFNKIFINFGWMMGYYDTQNRFATSEKLTWGKIYKDNKKPLCGGTRFYVLVDIVVAIIYGTIVTFTNLNIVNVASKSIAWSFVQPIILFTILAIYAGCLAMYAVCQKRKNFYETT